MRTNLMRTQMSIGLDEKLNQREVFVDKSEIEYQSAIKPQRYVIRSRSLTRYYWDIFILILALYNSVMTPFSFSFDYMLEKVSQPPLIYIEYGIDLCYFFDIIIGFMTSYIDPFTGDEFYGFKKRALHYIKGDFIIDVLSTFWFKETF